MPASKDPRPRAKEKTKTKDPKTKKPKKKEETLFLYSLYLRKSSSKNEGACAPIIGPTCLQI